MTTHNFNKKLEYTRSVTEKTDTDIIKKVLIDCTKVMKTDIAMDKLGIDYIATLKDGAEVNIDSKTREPGCSKYWRYGEPELPLETWSIKEIKSGWTVDKSTNVDYILFVFPPEDTDKIYFIPYQLLRIVFRKNLCKWEKLYGTYRQTSQSDFGNVWQSECVFVPASVVIEAINREMCQELAA